MNKPGRSDGVALVLVLGFIVLVTVLAVAFVASVTTEGTGQQAAAAENSASQLAGSAVQLVEGTISFATEPAGDTSYAWACQPGMIRTYGTAGGGPGATAPAGASSSPLAYYKLYSSNNMVISGTANCNAFTAAANAFGTANADVPQYWDQAPSLFADLNAPIMVQPAGGGAPVPTFPILDPRALDLSVEGFSTSASSGNLDGTVSASGNSANFSTTDAAARLPMPVRWMYVLRDGTMTVPDTPAANTLTGSSTVTSVSWSSTAANIPTAANPIVGRVAFWTDDESAKVNVNTASEGTYWDTPICNSGLTSDAFTYPQTKALGDAVFANYQPAQHEYQRYPGHPATTCLSSIFGSALSSLGSRATIVQAITNAIPRITDNPTVTSTSGMSSMGGTQNSLPIPYPTPPVQPLTTDLDRLYASLDEFQFAAPTPPGSAPPRVVQTLGTAGASATTEQNLVDTCRFFLTAHSKAPEVNMFGLPRVAMWPLWDTTQSTSGNLTPFDQDILRCSTVAATTDPHQFAFFRANPLSTTADWNNIARNQQVYGYLHNLMNQPVPGFGNSFGSKYSTTPASGAKDSDQILTEIFDYIRCTNLADNSNAGTSTAATPYTGSYSSSPQANVGVASPFGTNYSPGQVVPIQIPASASVGANTQGFGRIATISEVVLMLTKVDDRITTGMTAPGGANYVHVLSGGAPGITVTGGGSINGWDPTKQTLVEWCLIPVLASPSCGYVALANNERIRFSNSSLVIGGTAASLGTSPYQDVYDVGRLCAARHSVMGGNIGFADFVESVGSPNASAPSDSMYPTGLALVNGVSSNSPPSPASSTTTMTISGGFTVTLYAPAGTNSAPGSVVQTFTCSFPSPITVPIPQIYITNSPYAAHPGWQGTFRAPPTAYTVNTSGTAPTATFAYPATPNLSTLSSYRLTNNYEIFSGGGADVIRSFVPTGPLKTGSVGTANPAVLGDLRVTASTANIPSTVFQETLTSAGASPDGGTSPAYDACEAWIGTLIPLPGNAHGAVSALIPYNKYQYFANVPPVSGGNSTPVMMPGNIPADWDNAPGLMADGPWINKPDEGMTESSTSNLPYIGEYQNMTESGAPQTTLFSPNRQVSSPVMFGSLLTGSDHPWRTLLFRPAVLPGYQGGYVHPGNNKPATTLPDHLMLDLFWMPVVEPYGISEPLATSGKINLNYQIQPFTYITRSTGLNAVLKSVMITALNPSTPGTSDFKFSTGSYKWAYDNTTFPNNYTRYPIDATQTLGQLYPATPDTSTANAFPEFSRPNHTAASPNFFVSASQVCDLPLIPLGYTPLTLSTFWSANSLTGDNSLERPYSMIYPRVTTKSNIFTVHVLAQSLKKIATDPNQNKWNENVDQVTGEYHAAYTIEKYFDPNTDDITTENSNGAQTTVMAASDNAVYTSSYTNPAIRTTKWRLLGMKRFGQ